MDNKFLLSIAVHRPRERAGGETCSILIDLLEAGQWNEVKDAESEPSFLDVAPGVVSDLLSSFLEAGYRVMLQARGNGQGSAITNRELPALWRNEVDPHAETRISAFLSRQPNDSAEAICFRADKSPRCGELLLTVKGSALSLFVDCSELRRAEMWVERAASASGLDVERRA